MKINYTPTENRIVVLEQKNTEPETTQAGIITDMAKKKVLKGEVLAAGAGRYAGETGAFIPCIIAKGDTILFGANSGMALEIEVDGVKTEVKLLNEMDVLLVLDKK